MPTHLPRRRPTRDMIEGANNAAASCGCGGGGGHGTFGIMNEVHSPRGERARPVESGMSRSSSGASKSPRCHNRPGLLSRCLPVLVYDAGRHPAAFLDLDSLPLGPLTDLVCVDNAGIPVAAGPPGTDL